MGREEDERWRRKDTYIFELLTSFNCRTKKLRIRKSCDLWIKSLIKLITSSHFVAFRPRTRVGHFLFLPFVSHNFDSLSTICSFQKGKVSFLILILVPFNAVVPDSLLCAPQIRKTVSSCDNFNILPFGPVANCCSYVSHDYIVFVACCHSTFTCRCCRLVPCIRAVCRRTFHCV